MLQQQNVFPPKTKFSDVIIIMYNSSLMLWVLGKCSFFLLWLIMQAPRQLKRLAVRQRVSGCIGNLVPNPNNPNNHQVRERLYGNVIAEAGAK